MSMKGLFINTNNTILQLINEEIEKIIKQSEEKYLVQFIKFENIINNMMFVIFKKITRKFDNYSFINLKEWQKIITILQENNCNIKNITKNQNNYNDQHYSAIKQLFCDLFFFNFKQNIPNIENDNNNKSQTCLSFSSNDSHDIPIDNSGKKKFMNNNREKKIDSEKRSKSLLLKNYNSNFNDSIKNINNNNREKKIDSEKRSKSLLLKNYNSNFNDIINNKSIDNNLNDSINNKSIDNNLNDTDENPLNNAFIDKNKRIESLIPYHFNIKVLKKIKEK